VADYINNVAVADAYTPALILGPDYSARRAVITVANNPVLMQFAIGDVGNWRWTDEREFFSIPQSFRVNKVIGVKFRNANAGQVARVLAVLSGDEDPDFESGVPFSGILSPTGAITPVNIQCAARIYAVGRNDAMANGVFLDAVMPSLDYQTDATMNATPNKITIPPGFGGKYVVSAAVQFNVNPSLYSIIRVLVNGGTPPGPQFTGAQIAGTQAAGPTHTDIVQLAAGDVVSFQVWQSNGGTFFAASLALAYISA
jgi:hypothetical protein